MNKLKLSYFIILSSTLLLAQIIPTSAVGQGTCDACFPEVGQNQVGDDWKLPHHTSFTKDSTSNYYRTNYMVNDWSNYDNKVIAYTWVIWKSNTEGMVFMFVHQDPRYNYEIYRLNVAMTVGATNRQTIDSYAPLSSFPTGSNSVSLSAGFEIEPKKSVKIGFGFGYGYTWSTDIVVSVNTDYNSNYPGGNKLVDIEHRASGNFPEGATYIFPHAWAFKIKSGDTFSANIDFTGKFQNGIWYRTVTGSLNIVSYNPDYVYNPSWGE